MNTKQLHTIVVLAFVVVFVLSISHLFYVGTNTLEGLEDIGEFSPSPAPLVPISTDPNLDLSASSPSPAPANEDNTPRIGLTSQGDLSQETKDKQAEFDYKQRVQQKKDELTSAKADALMKSTTQSGSGAPVVAAKASQRQEDAKVEMQKRAEMVKATKQRQAASGQKMLSKIENKGLKTRSSEQLREAKQKRQAFQPMDYASSFASSSPWFSWDNIKSLLGTRGGNHASSP